MTLVGSGLVSSYDGCKFTITDSYDNTIIVFYYLNEDMDKKIIYLSNEKAQYEYIYGFAFSKIGSLDETDLETGEEEIINIDTEEMTEKNTKNILDENEVYNAVVNYCCSKNTDLSDMIDDDYAIYWTIEEQDKNTYIVTYRSYTGAITYYHVDKYTGETTSTEFVPGITDGEQEGTDHFNVIDYLS
mgnify:CR=1 FL=1